MSLTPQRWRACGTLLLLVVVASAGAAPAVEDYTRFAEYETMRLSPAGDRVAVTRRTEDMESVTVLDVDTLELLSSTQFGRRTRIDNLFWATNDRLLIQPAQRVPGRVDGFFPTGEIIGMNADGRGSEILFGFRASNGRGISRGPDDDAIAAAGQVVDLLPAEEDHVIVQSMGWGFEGIFTRAYRMHIRTGKRFTLASSPIRNGRFVTDANHQVALVAGADERAYGVVYDMTVEAGREAPVHVQDRDGGMIEPLGPWPQAASDGSSRFLVRETVLGGTAGLALWTPASDDLEELARHPDVDVDSWHRDPTGRVYAVRFLDHFPVWLYPDPEHPLARIHAGLAQANPEDDVAMVSVSADGQRAVALLHGPRNPGVFLLVDVPQLAVLRRLAARPWLARDALTSMGPVQVEARDGTALRGYVTEPVSAAGTAGPMVVLVHGGPHGAQDRWGFRPDVQLLSAHGYKVLQINFRGSGGRGEAFEESGHGRWGAEMQDDVTDAVRWAIASGIADPDRICIMGASYGAYSALAGAFREPDLFRCAVGMAGVYDLELMFDKGDIRTTMAGQAFLERVLGEDVDLLRSRSPVHNADRIRAAVLLAHGDLDRRAPIEHAHRMRRALRKAGNAPRWIRQRREGHGFLEADNRREYWEQVLGFLDEHIGAAAAPSDRVAGGD